MSAPTKPPEPPVTPAVAAISDSLLDKVMQGETEQLKATLKAQPRVRTYVPLDDEDKKVLAQLKAGDQRRPAMRVQINSLVLYVPKGVQVDVPESVADVISHTLSFHHEMNNRIAGEGVVGIWVDELFPTKRD